MIKAPLFQNALPLLEKIERAGYQAYFVGGCVRDAILQKPIADVDIATSAYPHEIKAIFPKTIDVGIEHGTVMVLCQQNSYEITTFRIESDYHDFRRPDSVTFVRTLSDDLMRRDFTMNALAMDARGKVYDFHNGIQAIQHKCIQAVGNSHERFHEDALRMMRGVRFAAQLDFDIAQETFDGIVVNAHLLEKIAIERIRVEFEKLMIALAKAKGIELFLMSRLFVYCPLFQLYEHQLRQFMTTPVCENVIEQWAMLLYCFNVNNEQASRLLKAWKLSNNDQKHILALLTIVTFRRERQWHAFDLFQYGKEISQQGEQLCVLLGVVSTAQDVTTLYDQLPIKRMQDIAINGNDVLNHLQLKKGGAIVGELLVRVKEALLEREIENDKNSLLQFVKTYYLNRVTNEN